MRVIYCVFLFAAACASHGVRCDGRLQPINPPVPRAAMTVPPQTAVKGVP